MKFTNDKDGRQIDLPDVTCKSDLLQKFLAAPDSDRSWLWFHIAGFVEEASRCRVQTREMISFLSDWFTLAAGMGLKSPKIRLKLADRRYKLYLSAKGTLCFMAGDLIPGTDDPVGDEQYMGCLFRGRFLGSDRRALSGPDQDLLDGLDADPVEFLARRSKDMDSCAYCAGALSDARSKQAGYGETCALRWGLPWGKGYSESAPSFARLWAGARPDDRGGIRGVCLAIRRAYWGGERSDTEWSVLADLMEEGGIPTLRARLTRLAEKGETLRVGKLPRVD
jgi:hypothetical protein